MASPSLHSAQQLHESMKQTVEAYFDSRLILAHGIVTAYSSEHHAVRVALQPQLGENLEEVGFIPLHTPWVGRGWGAKMAPYIGSQVTVLALGSPAEFIFAFAGFFDLDNKPPGEAISPGELVLRHESGSKIEILSGGEMIYTHAKGSKIRFVNNGDVEVNVVGDLIANVDGDLNAAVDGDLTADVTGSTLLECDDVKIGDGSAVALVRHPEMMALYNAHVHKIHSDTSTPPMALDAPAPMTPLQATTKVKGT